MDLSYRAVGVRSLASLPAKTPGATLLRSLQQLFMSPHVDGSRPDLPVFVHTMPSLRSSNDDSRLHGQPPMLRRDKDRGASQQRRSSEGDARVARFTAKTPCARSTCDASLCLVDQRWHGAFESISLRPLLRSSQTSSGVSNHATHQCDSLGMGREPSMRDQGESLASGFATPVDG